MSQYRQSKRDRRLMSYALGGLALTTGEAGGEIVHVDLGAGGVTVHRAEFGLDFDADGTAEVDIRQFYQRFSCTTYGSCGPYFSIGVTANLNSAGDFLIGRTVPSSPYSDSDEARAFLVGEWIDSAMAPPGGRRLAVNVQDVIAGTYGNFFGPGTKYLGISFESNQQTRHVGWASLAVNNALDVTIFGYAYETEPGVPILAGDKGDPPNVPGDTNGDGQVDLEDLNNVRNNFGASGDAILGDTNGDDLVDLEDLNAVRNNFGAGNAVPEPPSLVLLAAGAAGLGVWRRKKLTAH